MRIFQENTLLIATHNQGKFEEIAKLFELYDVSLISSSRLQISEPKETETSFLGNARIKAHHAAKSSGLVSLSDDSGLEVECLNGAPGVYTADWAETENGRDFNFAMELLWKKVTAKTSRGPYKARFCSTLVLAWPDGHDEHFEGQISGNLVWPIRGKKGHGFDPIFVPNGYRKTFGEMDRWKKNAISHRGVAFEKLKKYCLASISTHDSL